MRKGPRHAAPAAAGLPCSPSASNSVVSSPNSATVTTSRNVFGGNSPAAASPSSGRRQQRLSRGSLSKASPSPPPSVSYTSQHHHHQQQRWQGQMKKLHHHHRGGGGGRREAQLRRLSGSSASDAAMSKPKVPPQSSLSGRRSRGSSSGDGDVPAGMCTVEDVVNSAVDPQAQYTISSNTSRSTTTDTDDDDGDKADSSSSPLLPQQQQQPQRSPDQSRNTKSKRNSKPPTGRGWANTQLWENVEQDQRNQRGHLQSRQDRRRVAAKRSGPSVKAGAPAHNVANEDDDVAGSVQGSAVALEEEEVTVSCTPRNGSRFSSSPATTAEETLENEEVLPAPGTRRVPPRSGTDAMATPSRRHAVTEGGGRSRHRRRLSPAHPVASSPAVSRDSSINDPVGHAAVDDETQPLPTLSHAGHDDKASAPADGPRRPPRAGNKQSRKHKHISAAVQQPKSGPGVATGMAPVTAIAAFSTRAPPPLFVLQDPIIVAQQVRPPTHAFVAESALPDPPPTVMRLAAFSPAKGSITDPCVVAAVLPTSPGAAAYAVGPAVPHGGRAKDTAAPPSPGPPTVVSSCSMPPQPHQQSEEDKQLSRRGLRFGAPPFYPASTASLVLAMPPEAGTNGGDASLPSLAAAVPSPQSLLGSYTMSPARSPPLMQPTSSPLGDSVQNHSRSSTGGLMSGQSTFAAELAAATSTPWTLTVIAPSYSSPPSSIGRDDTDGDGPSSGTPSVPVKSPAHGAAAAAAASYSSNTEMQNVTGDRPAMRRSALMVTNTATGACVSPATVTTPSGSPTALWSGSGGHVPQMRTSGHTSGANSIAAAAATTPGGTGHHSATPSSTTLQGVVVREFPQAPYPVVNRTTELHQPHQQHSMRSPRLMSESDLDCVQHNRVAVSDVVAKDEGTLVDTLFADVNMIEDDESEVEGDDVLSSRGGGERWTMHPAPSPVASGDGSPLVASSPDVRTPHSMNQQLQHRSGSFSAGARMLAKEAGGQVFGGGYWYPSGPWASTDGTARGSGTSGTGTGSYRGGGGDVKTTLAAAVTASIGSASVAAAWRGLSTPPHRHRAFSASCASVASTVSLIDPKQPQADGAAYDMMGEDDEWEINSSAYADSLDEAQIQWIEEQLRATENPAGYF